MTICDKGGCDGVAICDKGDETVVTICDKGGCDGVVEVKQVLIWRASYLYSSLVKALLCGVALRYPAT